MIESALIPPDPIDAPRMTYPKLLEQPGTGLIVYALQKSERGDHAFVGVVVNRGNTTFQMSTLEKDWQLKEFRVYHGKVVLSNVEGV